MNARDVVLHLTYVELTACVLVLAIIFYRKQVKEFAALASFLAVRALSTGLLMSIWTLATYGFSKTTAYKIYFYVYWVSYALEALLGIGIIWGVYRLAMAPLKGLQTLGILMFRWAAAIGVIIALVMAAGPHVSATMFIMHAVTQLQQTEAILTLCLLLFVTLAIRPMGLSYRSRIFGVSFGLGLLATMGLVSSAWIPQTTLMFAWVDVVNGTVMVTALMTWGAYFALPEPKRRMIVLPTTSPFLRWNQISEALGDAPGYVAVGGVHPEIFAPAELEVMRRASMKMIMEPISIGE